MTTMNQLTFGIEIECYLPSGMTRADFAAQLAAAGINSYAEGYSHSTRGHWKIITDSSLDSLLNGAELVSPVLQGEEGFLQVHKVMTQLSRVGATVNKKCGLHVHIGVRYENLDFFKNLFKIYHGFEEVIDSMMPVSRRARNNNYIRSLKGINLAQVDAAQNMEDLRRLFRQNAGGEYYARYHKLNFEAFWRHGTVEFRQHSGTINSSKAISWIRTCMKMVLRAKKELALVRTESTQVPSTRRIQPARRWTNKARIIDMLYREEGVTTSEINDLIGNNTWGTIPEITASVGMQTRRVKVGREYRYWAVQEMETVTRVVSSIEFNQDTFCQILELDAMESAYVGDRIDALSGQTRMAEAA